MIHPAIVAVIVKRLGLPPGAVALTGDTQAWEVPGWDSLTHASIIIDLERAMGIRISIRESLRLQSLGELSSLIVRKRVEAGLPPL